MWSCRVSSMKPSPPRATMTSASSIGDVAIAGGQARAGLLGLGPVAGGEGEARHGRARRLVVCARRKRASPAALSNPRRRVRPTRGLAEGGAGDLGRRPGRRRRWRARAPSGAAAGPAAVQLADQLQDGGEDAAVDADGGAGQGQQLRAGRSRSPGAPGRPRSGPAWPARRRTATAGPRAGRAPDSRGAAGRRRAASRSAAAPCPRARRRGPSTTGAVAVGAARVGLAARPGRAPSSSSVGVEAEAVGQRLAQRLADPDVELQGQVAGELRVARQRRAQGGDLAGGLDQPPHVGLGERRRCRCRPARSAPPARRPARMASTTAAPRFGPARDLDLVLDRRLDQQADQVGVLEHRAGGDDRPGDLDLVEGQHVDQGRRAPSRRWPASRPGAGGCRARRRPPGPGRWS